MPSLWFSRVGVKKFVEKTKLFISSSFKLLQNSFSMKMVFVASNGDGRWGHLPCVIWGECCCCRDKALQQLYCFFCQTKKVRVILEPCCLLPIDSFPKITATSMLWPSAKEVYSSKLLRSSGVVTVERKHQLSGTGQNMHFPNYFGQQWKPPILVCLLRHAEHLANFGGGGGRISILTLMSCVLLVCNSFSIDAPTSRFQSYLPEQKVSVSGRFEIEFCMLVHRYYLLFFGAKEAVKIQKPSNGMSSNTIFPRPWVLAVLNLEI